MIVERSAGVIERNKIGPAPFGQVRFPQIREEIPDGRVQGVRDFNERGYLRVVEAALDVRNRGSVLADRLREVVLTEFS